jgi:hypothetical protein
MRLGNAIPHGAPRAALRVRPGRFRYLTRDDIIATATLSLHSPGSEPYDQSVLGVAAPPGSVTAQLIADYLDSPEGTELRNEILWVFSPVGGDTQVIWPA